MRDGLHKYPHQRGRQNLFEPLKTWLKVGKKHFKKGVFSA